MKLDMDRGWLSISKGLLILMLLTVPALARDDGQWGSKPFNIRQWFQTLMQPDNPVQSCCGEADAFEADTFEVQGDHYVAVITDGKGMLPNGTRIGVPNQKIKWDQGNPTGHGIIFLSGTISPNLVRGEQTYVYVLAAGEIRLLYCYVPPGGV